MNTIVRKGNGMGNVPATTFSELVDKIFQNNLNRFFADDLNGGLATADRYFGVPLNIKETEKSFELDLVAPGLKKEDFKVNVADDALTISYEHQEEANQENKQEGWVRKEYKMNSFSRSIHVDETIDAHKITGNYADGILHLSLPKKEGAQKITRNVEIN